MEVELLIGCGGSDSYQVLTNSECHKMFFCSEPAGAKARGRERENSDHQLRSPNMC